MLVPLEKIQTLAEQIAEEFKPNRIYLFGSYAYGEPTKDSDIDLLVVMNSPDDRPAFFASAKISRFIVNFDHEVDIVVRDPADFKDRVQGFDGFLSKIAADGLLLYNNESQAA